MADRTGHKGQDMADRIGQTGQGRQDSAERTWKTTKAGLFIFIFIFAGLETLAGLDKEQIKKFVLSTFCGADSVPEKCRCRDGHSIPFPTGE